MHTPFVPRDFVMPPCPVGSGWQMRPLHPDDVAMDYEAVMSSRTRLRQVFAQEDTWPRDDMSLQEDRRDLEAHFSEFTGRKSFAWMVVDTAGRLCLGCVYLYPPMVDDYDVEVYLWVRDSELDNGLDDTLESAIADWLNENWPFIRPAWPGRRIPWSEWPGQSRFSEGR